MQCTCVLRACYAWEEPDVGEWGSLAAPGYFNRIQFVRLPLGQEDRSAQNHWRTVVWESSSKAMRAAIGAGVGIGFAVIGAPVAIWAAGFTGAGIAAGSFAAKMMSAAAIANGGGVAAGSLVATLQSAGAVGLSLGAKAGLGTALGSVGAAVGSWFSKDK
nr:interferon alpha-inducible protein 27-like protein 2A isoform X2 [Chrysemys picta bellii]